MVKPKTIKQDVKMWSWQRGCGGEDVKSKNKKIMSWFCPRKPKKKRIKKKKQKIGHGGVGVDREESRNDEGEREEARWRRHRLLRIGKWGVVGVRSHDCEVSFSQI